MATSEEIYNSICETIQRNIDLLDNEIIYLSREQIAEILNRIGKLNNKIKGIKKNTNREFHQMQ